MTLVRRNGLVFPSFSTHYLLQVCGRLKLTALLLLLVSAFPQTLLAHGNDSEMQQGGEHEEIRIVMSGAFVSEHGLKVYDDIADYLQQKLAHKVAFVSGFSYSVINSMLETGMADIGFVCGLPYTLEHDKAEPSVELLLAPVMKDPRYHDKPVYYAYVIVNKDSKYASFSDLKGTRFTYSDEISNSGYNMPRARLIELGETQGFFSEVIRSGSHEESIRMVASGVSDVSAVDSLVYDYDREKNPANVNKTKVIEVLGPAGIPPVVVSTRLSPQIREKIRDIFLSMKDDPAGRAIMDRALVDHFELVDDNNYDSIREMYSRAYSSGYTTIR